MIYSADVINSQVDALGPDELEAVDHEPREVTEKEDNHDADEDPRKIHLIIGRAVPVSPHMGVFDPLEPMHYF